MYSYFNVMKDTRSSLLEESFIFFYFLFERDNKQRHSLQKQTNTPYPLIFQLPISSWKAGIDGNNSLQHAIYFTVVTFYRQNCRLCKAVGLAYDYHVDSSHWPMSCTLRKPFSNYYYYLYMFFLIIEKVKRAYNIDYTVLAREEMIVYRGEKTTSIYRENTSPRSKSGRRVSEKYLIIKLFLCSRDLFLLTINQSRPMDKSSQKIKDKQSAFFEPVLVRCVHM